MNITRRWKKLLAVSCSHGKLIDRRARHAILKFRERYNPDTVAHLGDFLDLTAFRAGAGDGRDSAQSSTPDIDHGLDFLERLHPTLVMCGNHEARLWNLQHHPKALVSDLAKLIISQVETAVKGIRAELVPYGYKVWREYGGYKLMHGTMFNENACRDHAEAYGNCIFGHTHRAGMASGRRSDHPTAFCTGSLAAVEALDYASQRRSTLGWSHGFVWGEYSDDAAVFYLHVQPQGVMEWRLPSV